MPLLVEAKEISQHPKLSGAYLALAMRLQEAAGDMTASHVGRTLSDAVQAAHKGTGKWASYLDHAGDDESGDVIYSAGGDTMSAPYEIAKGDDGTAATAKLDLDSARKVSPRVTYEDCPEDDSDGMETMYEAALYTRGGIPLVERFVSKAERDTMDEGSFAGKGKSFPINKPGDIMAAVHSMGRAGTGNYGPAALKAKIIAIAKRKGWTKYLPKAWQGDDAKEALKPGRKTGSCALQIVETTARVDDAALDLIESAAGAEMEVKLIAPGKGATAYYTAEALKQAAEDKVFDKGTQIYINHATRAEEAERPEGDWHKLVGALKVPAYYLETHKQGPGLYSKAAFAPDMAPLIKAKAPYSGMSIRANGDAVMESGRPKLRDGVPVLRKFISAESVDIVTRAGAGGMILTEAARAANSQQQEASMDAEEIKLLRESVARLSGKETRREAIQEGARILRDVSLPDAAKEYVIETVLKESLPMKDGALDIAKFTECVNAEARRFGAAIGGPRVIGMGVAAPVQPTEAQRAAQRAAAEAEDAMYRKSWATFFDGDLKLAEAAAKGRAA